MKVLLLKYQRRLIGKVPQAIKGTDLKMSSYSCENNMLKISHLNTFYSLRYAHVRYVKSLFRLFTNIQKQ